ncbi:MAG TPA: hypothetical protein VJB12_04360, partial [Candidatus Nanoarchaeia archaeon]|nr:hypothetical protein [Candidatus Nanoarchaeia archaeon]
MEEKRGEGRKAQLSVFMILSVVILIGGVVWFVFMDAAEEGIPNMPSEAAPLHQFIANCLMQSLDSVLREVGATGGYADIPASIQNDPSAYLQAGPFAAQRMPYWWHDGIESVPPLDFIKLEAEKAAERNFISCLDNFTDFRTMYTITAQSGPRIAITFTEEGTTATASYPLEASTKDNQTAIAVQDFTESSPIRFLLIHRFASTIMERENKDAFLEKKTIDLMALDPDSIPITDFDVRCDPKTWRVSEVKARIQRLVNANIPFIKIKGTPYLTTQYVPTPFGGQSFEDSYYSQHYVWDLGVEDFGGLRASFTYEPSWPTIFNVRPSSGDTMTSSPVQGTEALSSMCMQIYHFTYDISYPVRVDLIDETPLSPYVFSFAFKSSIDHNEPSRDNQGYALFDSNIETSVFEYCENKDHEITVLTVDNLTGESIKDVNLTFTCGRFRCDMGSTQWLSLGQAAGKTSLYPPCVNGILRASKPGYLTSEQFIQTQDDGASYLVFLSPMKTVRDIKVVKHPLQNPSRQEILSASEIASISIRSQNGHSTYATYPSEGSAALDFPKGQELTYHVSIRLISDDDASGGYEGE